MGATAPRSPARRHLTRRDFVTRTAPGSAAALVLGGRAGRAAAAASPYAEWIPASTKPPRRGGVLTRAASAWDPPVIDPRLTQSIGLFQLAGLTSNRLVRYPFADEATGPSDMSLKGGLAESWSASSDCRQWTFKLRQGVKWQNVAPVNGREFVAADVKYCFEQYAKEGVQAFTLQEVEATETPDKYTVRVHLRTPNTLFPQNLAEPVAVMFAREVLEEDGDLKKRLIGTGPYTLKEHTRKVRVVLQRNPDYWDTGRPYVDEYVILSTPNAATRLAAFRTGQADFIWVASPSEVETIRKTNPRRSSSRTTTRWHRSAWPSPRTSSRSTTCACGGRSRWPSTARGWSTPSSRATASSAGACPTSIIGTPSRRPRTSARTGSTARPRPRSS